MGITTFYWAAAIVLVVFIIIGYFRKGKSKTGKAWDNFYNFLNWLPFIFIFISLISLIFFREELISAMFSSEFVLFVVVAGLLIIGFPLLALASIGLWIGDFLEKITKK